MAPDEIIDLGGLNPTGRFSDRADDYRRFRPDYPQPAIDAILDGLGEPTRLVAADLGAGTGISARQLADRGVRVVAVEPNPEMRAAAAPHPRVEWREGTAEDTGLEPASVSLLLCAQAFHWFRPREALAEIHRILEPGGRLALMWNRRDRKDPLTRGYTEAIHAVNGEDPIERMPFDPAVVPAGGAFSAPAVAHFPHAQALDLHGVIGRATSASYVPKDGDRFARLGTLLTALWKRHHDAEGRVTLRYVTELFLSRRR